MSKKSFKRWFLIRYFSKSIFEKFDYIFPQNKETLLYFKKLGVKKKNFWVTLNLLALKIKKEKFKKNTSETKEFYAQQALTTMRRKSLQTCIKI